MSTTDPARARMRDTLQPSVQLLLFGVAVTLLGVLGVVIRPADGSAAMWWPAAGIAVVGLLVAHRRQRLAVVSVLVLAGTLSGLVGHRPPLVAVLLALVNAVGAFIVVLVLSYHRPDPRALYGLGDLMRVLSASLLGGITAGLTAGVIAVGLLDVGFLASAAGVAASHAASVVLVLPFALHTFTAPVEAKLPELAAQWLATVVVTAMVFAPGQRLPLVFLLLLVLLWPALRSGLLTTGLHLATVGIMASFLTLRGAGPLPFAAGAEVRPELITIGLVQVLAMTMASVMLAVLVTVSQRRSLLLETSRREELFRVGFTESLLGILLLRPDGDMLRIVELNGVAARLLEGQADELIGTVWCERFDPADHERVTLAVANMAAGDAAGWKSEIHLASTGADRWVEVSISPAVEGTSAGDLLTVQMVDVTARRAAEARLADLALHDGLTGLANRTLLDDRLERALAETQRTQMAVGVMFLDLNEFKDVNDTFGHEAGDRVLVEIGTRLRKAVRDTDTVARFGGDEFVIVCPGLANHRTLDELYRRIQVAVSAPILISGSRRRLDASIGVAIGNASSQARELLHQADTDMYAHKTAYQLQPVA